MRHQITIDGQPRNIDIREMGEDFIVYGTTFDDVLSFLSRQGRLKGGYDPG